MKRFVQKVFTVCVAATICCLSIVACAPNNAISFTVQYENVTHTVETPPPPVRLIRSENDFMQCMSDAKIEKIKLEQDFFVNNYAVVVSKETSNTNISYEVKYVQWVDDNSLTVTIIDKTDNNADGATVMGTYYMVIGIATEYEIPDASSITVNYR